MSAGEGGGKRWRSAGEAGGTERPSAESLPPLLRWPDRPVLGCQEKVTKAVSKLKD